MVLVLHDFIKVIFAVTLIQWGTKTHPLIQLTLQYLMIGLFADHLESTGSFHREKQAVSSWEQCVANA